MTETQDIEVQEVECPRRACTRNDSGLCTLYGPEDGDLDNCKHFRLREDCIEFRTHYVEVEISDDGKVWRRESIDLLKTNPETADVKEGQFIRLKGGKIYKVFREHNLQRYEEWLVAWTRETAEKRGLKW